MPKCRRALAGGRIIHVEAESERIHGQIKHAVFPRDGALYAHVVSMRLAFRLLGDSGRFALPDGDEIVDGAATALVLVAPAMEEFQRRGQRCLAYARTRGESEALEEGPQ